MTTHTLDPRSILINTDSYKVSMWKQYPPGTEHVYSYIEARGDGSEEVLWFGLQAFLMEYLTTPVTMDDVIAANEFWTAHGEPFNLEGWKYIVEKCGGRLPIHVSQIPEGTLVPTGTVLAVVENTDPNVPWITTWVETALLRAAWYGTNVATTSYNIKKLLLEYMEKSGTPGDIGFKLHDFGSRGASCYEASSIGGAAHLINFMGTDNAVGIYHANKYYGSTDSMLGYSVPAAEHSTITSWGRDNELKAYENMIEAFGNWAIFACVSDSYNIYEAVEMWGGLRDKLRESNTTLVVRPDSGDPVEVLSKIIPQLDHLFGSALNDKGYKTLNNVRVLWGDGINQQSIQVILSKLVDEMGYSVDNLAFGMGGALLQGHARDTYKFAMKASAARINGNWVDVFKDPVDDPGKTSKKGRVVPAYDPLHRQWLTMTDADARMAKGAVDEPLRLVYACGAMYAPSVQTFDDVRWRATPRVLVVEYR